MTNFSSFDSFDIKLFSLKFTNIFWTYLKEILGLSGIRLLDFALDNVISFVLVFIIRLCHIVMISAGFRLKSLAFFGRCTSVGRRHWDVEVYVVIIASVLEQFVIV
jgi:hypothetical protein